jgi:hypothetical protein
MTEALSQISGAVRIGRAASRHALWMAARFLQSTASAVIEAGAAHSGSRMSAKKYFDKRNPKGA